MKCFMTGRECEHNMEENPYKVFVISPFGYPFDDLYKHGIQSIVTQIRSKEITGKPPPAGVDDSLQTERADQAIQLGFVMCQRICRKIRGSKYIIADVTQPNKNVFYELGLSYALNKNIILIGRKQEEDSLTFGLINNENEEAYIHYRSLNDFRIDKKGMFMLAFKKSIKSSLARDVIAKSIVLNITNLDHSIQGLHERGLQSAINELNNPPKSFLYNEDWIVATKPISNSSIIDEFLSEFEESKVCTIDTTDYDKSSPNPYVYFCLGLGHGYEREMIPLTHTSRSDRLPFDVRGLWHIFFDDLSSLKQQFKGIFSEIDKECYETKRDYLFRKFWNPVFKHDNDLYIMTCARDSDDPNRGIRTHIDKWDYTTVSELTRFLALKYPNSQVRITTPRSKLSKNEIELKGIPNIRSDIELLLIDKDCIIVGSPDVSDLAEIVLSELHNILPYNENRLKSKGYIIIKNMQRKIISSFIWERKNGEKEGIAQILGKDGRFTTFSNQIDDSGGTIYGILTVANNPFYKIHKNKKIIILAGFSGPATNAIAKLLTQETYTPKLDELFEKTHIHQNSNVEILVGMRFSFDNTLDGKGDNRIFRDQPDDIFVVGTKEI